MKIKYNIALILLAGATSVSAAQEDGRDAHESTIGAFVATTSSPQYASALDPHSASTKPTFMTLPTDIVGIILQFLVGSTIETRKERQVAMTMKLLSKTFNTNNFLNTGGIQTAFEFVTAFKFFNELTQHKTTAIATCFPNLMGLTIESCSDDYLVNLRVFTNLTSLKLTYCCGITGAGLAHLSTLINLTTLSLSGDGITDAGLAHLSTLENLTNLDLSFCYNVTGAGLDHLSALTNLTNLNLSDCHRITDAGLDHLSTLTNLTDLNLTYSGNFTDAGLAHLSTLENLTRLNLTCCGEITDAGLEMLRAANPNLKVRR
jgi:hypothetical protein